MGLEVHSHSRLLGRAVALVQVASVTRGHDVLPDGTAAPVARYHVVVVELARALLAAAVAAAEAVARENIHTRELHALLVRAEFLAQAHDRRNTDRHRRRADLGLVLLEYIDLAGYEQADCLLPGGD